MKVEFYLSPEEASHLRAEMRKEHGGYYAVYGDGGSRPSLGYWESEDAWGWRSQGGNVLSVAGNKARYEGRRHGLTRGGFLSVCAEILHAPFERGDWRYLATSERGWSPFDVAEDNA